MVKVTPSPPSRLGWTGSNERIPRREAARGYRKGGEDVGNERDYAWSKGNIYNSLGQAKKIMLMR